MSHHRQLRRRAHRHPLRVELEHDPFQIWLPPADDPIVIATFGHAASVAFDVLETGAEREVLVLLDERRQVTAMLLDPPPPVGVLIGSCEMPCLEVPFSQTLSIVVADHVPDGPPSDDDRVGYQSLRRLHMLQGLLLLDVILTDAERIQSLAIACDPDPIWFEPFEPFEPFEGFEPDAPDAPDARLDSPFGPDRPFGPDAPDRPFGPDRPDRPFGPDAPDVPLDAA